MAVLRLRLEVEQVGGGLLYSANQTLGEGEVGWQEYKIVTATTDQAIPFTLSTGITTVDAFLITSDYQISWRAAAADTALTLDANRVHLLWGCNLTAILISNASGSTATVKILIAG